MARDALFDAGLVAAAREVLRSEAASIESVAGKLDERLARAVEMIFERTGEMPGSGSVVVSGIGKSGLVGQRISASFASTGTPSHFLHPVEALHGDLGRVRRQDVALLLSYSGETNEIVRLLDLLKRQGVPIVAITSTRESSLGRLADITIELGRIEEVCPHGLAPTTTVNCISAVGDALVLGVMSLRKFSKEDFAAFHPGGSLGRQLMKVHQVMEFKVGRILRRRWKGRRCGRFWRRIRRRGGARGGGCLCRGRGNGRGCLPMGICGGSCGRMRVCWIRRLGW